MTLADGVRFWFIFLYILNIVVFTILVIRFRPRRNKIEKKKGILPTPGALISWGIPLVILLTRLGEIHTSSWIFLLLGLIISLYHILVQTWGLRALGRFYIPGSGVLQDHKLVTSGPFQYVRHPIYSALIALWLAAAIGTMNWPLLVLWPAYVAAMVLGPIRQEEELLNDKFGEDYSAYSKTTGQIIPKVRR